MKKKINFKSLKFILLLLSAIFVACKDDQLGNPDRLFRPIVGGNVGGTWVTATWDKYEGSLNYHVEFSEFDDFSVLIKDTIIEETSITISNLEYNTTYYIRVQAFGEKIESRPSIFTTKTSKFPTKMAVPISNDMIDTQARITWEDIEYDSLRVFIGKTHVKTILLSSEDNLNKIVIVKDLDPETTYTVKAYLAGDYLGEQDYKTTAPQIFEGDYIDLRGMDPEEAYTLFNQDYFDSIADLYPTGILIVMEGGTHYDIPTINMSINTKFISGLSFLGRAVWDFRGGVGVKSGVPVDYLKLEGIIVTDHPEAPKSSGNYGGKYLIDVRGTTAENTVGEISVVNCDVRYKRGLFRAQAPVLVENIKIENCLIDSMGGYGVVNADNSASYFKNILIKNTTISHCDKILVDGKSDPNDIFNSVTLENVTIATKGSNYVLDYNAKLIPGGITIKNCIFVNGDGGSPKGMRHESNTLTLDENYRSADLQWTNPIDTEVLSQTTSEIFEDVNSMNFNFLSSFTNDKILGKVGDPRWWQ